MIARLWDARAGAFVVNRSDPRRNHTQDAQVEAVFAGVTNRTQSRRALRFISTRLLRQLGVANGEFDDDPYMSNYISPFISSTELLARLRYGDARGALGGSVARGGTCSRPALGRCGRRSPSTGCRPTTSRCRSRWTPSAAATSARAGCRSPTAGAAARCPRSPATSSASAPRHLASAAGSSPPQPGDLRFAQGRAPTPHGAIASRWTRGKGRRSFKLTIAAPRGTRGVVDVPVLGQRRAIAMDGRLVWDGRRDRGGTRARQAGGAVRFSGLRGRHTFAWAAAR